MFGWLENIQTRLTIFVVATFLLVLLAGVYSFTAFQRIISEKDEVAFDYSNRMIEVEEMRSAFEEKVAQSRGYFLTGRKELLDETEKARDKFLIAWNRLNGMVTTVEGREFLDTIQILEREHDATLKAFVRQRVDTAGFRAQYDKVLRPKRRAVKFKLEDFVRFEKTLFAEAQRESLTSAARSELIIYAISFLTFGMALLVAALLLRTTRRARAASLERSEILQRSTDQLLLITDAQPGLIGYIDRDCIYRFANDSYRRWFGFTKDRVVGKHLKDVFGPEAFAYAKPRIDEAFAGKVVEYEGEFPYPDRPRYIRAKYAPDIDGGEVLGAFISITDLTNEKKDEVRLKDEIETRELLVNMITHDLRTPLSAAKMAAQLLIREKDDHDARVMLATKIVDNANRMEEMVRDLLDTNRIRVGKKLTIHPVDCDLPALLKSTIEDLAIIHGDRFVLTAPRSSKGVWDCAGLRRVAENILNNAVKYGKPQTPIEVTVRDIDGSVEIAFQNQGEPLSAEELSTLFEKFARSPSAESSGKLGWGIGLTLVRGIAEAHGGKVSVASDHDGTTFKVWLPRDARAFARASDVRPSLTTH